MLFACKSKTNDNNPNKLNHFEKEENVTSTQKISNDKTKDTLLIRSISENTSKKPETGKTQTKNKHLIKELISYDRYSEFPSDDTWNGKPLVQQTEIPLKVIESYPDTLSARAVALYNSFVKFFPVSIADNFEEGISTEIISYPAKLIFCFQVFQDKYAATPYLTKKIIIRRNEKGETYAE